jgi:hypothetical protein
MHVLVLFVILCSLHTESFRFQKVALDDDDRDRPAASTGHSLLARGNSLWLFGGIIEWYAKQGEKGRIQYGHVLWQYDQEYLAWERTMASGGSTHRKLEENQTVEIRYMDLIASGQVQSTNRKDGLVDVAIEQYPGHHQTIAVPLQDILYYPPPMNMHVAVLHGDKLMYVHPGKSKSGKPICEIWAYSFEKDVWTRLYWPSGSSEPKPREMHAGVSIAGGLLIYGGNKGKDIFSDLWHFSFSNSRWTEIKPTSNVNPPPIWGHSAVTYDNKMWIFGGHDADACISDLWYFDWEEKMWVNETDKSTAQPPPRKGHSVVIYSHCMLMFGGHDSGGVKGFMADLWAYDFMNSSWREIKLTVKPPPRNFHKAAILADEMYVFGGNNDDGLLSDFWSINVSKICS